MKILILGSGLMGPAAAFNAMSNPEVSQVVVCDLNQQQLDACASKLAGMEGSEKLSTTLLDLHDQAAAAELMAGFDVSIGALPGPASALAIRAASQANIPHVDLTRPDSSQLPGLRQEVEAAGNLVILACGVEPGLTEIMARHLAEKLDRVDELHIKCGGIPEKPTPPLGYRIVFGGRQLPLRESDRHASHAHRRRGWATQAGGSLLWRRDGHLPWRGRM